MTELLPPHLWVYVVLLLAAALVGLAKTGVPGIGTIAVALFAALLPAKSSTAVVLLLLLIADLCAILKYRKHANWALILRLIPAVFFGLASGALFLAFADDTVMRRSIGIIVILLTLIAILKKTGTSGRTIPSLPLPAQRIGYGWLSGFTTMVANAGGAATTLYLLANKLPVISFLGTTAWFYAVVNITKLPIMIGLGLITPSVMHTAVLLLPGLALGIIAGFCIATRIRQAFFEWMVLTLTLLGGCVLVLQ